MPAICNGVVVISCPMQTSGVLLSGSEMPALLRQRDIARADFLSG